MIFHIGYHKCGCTTLAENFFTHHHEFVHLGKPNEYGAAQRRLFDNISGIEYSTQYCIDIYKNEMLPCCDQNKKLSMSDGRVLRYHPEVTASRISKIFNGNIKIIIVLRDRVEMLQSLFMQQMGIFQKLDINEWIQKEWWWLFGWYLRYEYVVDTYKKHIGASNVLVLNLNEFSEDIVAVENKICDFCEISRSSLLGLSKAKNPRATSRHLLIRRYAGLRFAADIYRRVMPESVQEQTRNFLSRGKRITPKINELWTTRIKSLEDGIL